MRDMDEFNAAVAQLRQALRDHPAVAFARRQLARADVWMEARGIPAPPPWIDTAIRACWLGAAAMIIGLPFAAWAYLSLMGQWR